MQSDPTIRVSVRNSRVSVQARVRNCIMIEYH